ncbi:hypothetical protein CNEO4_440040 [Clostridium neonatale]|uniref:Uncharacterized protein n=1 Tax=Clostridium neonatale TaxID=137838 RepID=A0AA86JKC6_9CLOT|nr:hypothetical protein CNEO_44419 [Clostridium neonatale]CAG9712510.1 hypothetical protein CNEO_470035 [Clostridium neonatale]CAG9716001.1 hypothetical protein CNEO_380035 [Clostridium neonatale]CAI3197299.1 hypothetical protein CNEO2_220034 [Clostridium neonatale]CAI3203074.1 hypothetical protein CNEO2_270034 [Clostridium neonatale]
MTFIFISLLRGIIKSTILMIKIDISDIIKNKCFNKIRWYFSYETKYKRCSQSSRCFGYHCF